MNRLWPRLCGLLTAILLLHAVGWSPTVARADEDDAADHLPGEVLVKLHPGADLAGLASDFELTVLDQFGARPIYRMAFAGDGDAPLMAAALAGDPRVAAAEPNYVGQTPEGTAKSSWAGGDGQPGYAEQWATGLLRLSDAHTASRGAGVTVAVLDTGVDASHPELAGRLVAGYDFVGEDDDPGEGGDADDLSYGHGTHVAGLIAITAPEAAIMPVRMLEPDGSGNLWVAIEALGFAVDPDGDPQTTDGANVINMSFSFVRESHLLDQFVREATCEDDDREPGDEDLCEATGERGVVFVAAAGNRASEALEYPAAEQVVGLLAVAATTERDELASFSNRGSWIHLAAPGEAIVSSVPGGYGVWSGTSMAAPLVAGTAALVRAREPGLLPGAVASRIVDAAADIGGPVPRRADAAAALGLPRTAIELGDVTCRGLIGAEIADNVTVPPGAACELRGTRVTGNVKVEAGATLRADGVMVSGNLEGVKAALVTVTGGSAVAGSVVVKEGGAATIERTRISGSVQLEKNAGALAITANAVSSTVKVVENGGGVTIRDNSAGHLQIEKNVGILTIAGNEISGDAQVRENRQQSGAVTIQSNSIGATLQCEKNRPALAGGGNTAGKAEGQCSALVGT